MAAQMRTSSLKNRMQDMMLVQDAVRKALIDKKVLTKEEVENAKAKI